MGMTPPGEPPRSRARRQASLGHKRRKLDSGRKTTPKSQFLMECSWHTPSVLVGTDISRYLWSLLLNPASENSILNWAKEMSQSVNAWCTGVRTQVVPRSHVKSQVLHCSRLRTEDGQSLGLAGQSVYPNQRARSQQETPSQEVR